MQIKEIIKEFGISMPKLASKSGIGLSSLKKKIEPEKYKGYALTEEECVRVKKTLSELKEKLLEVC